MKLYPMGTVTRVTFDAADCRAAFEPLHIYPVRTGTGYFDFDPTDGWCMDTRCPAAFNPGEVTAIRAACLGYVVAQTRKPEPAPQPDTFDKPARTRGRGR